MKKSTWFCVASVLAALLIAGGADAVDLDKLKRLQEKFKKHTQPAETQPASGQPAAPVSAEADLPRILPVGEVPEADEIKIGRYVSGNLLGAAPLVADDALQHYVNRVGRWVAATSDRPNLRWTFGVIESESVNAFAAPGGYVFLTRGLYKLLGDEAELAGVLGHEIGHVVRRHHLKVLQKSQLLGAGSDLIRKQLDNKIAKSLVGTGAEIMARGLDKDAEFEADRIGVVLATRAGYDPYGLPSILQEIGHIAAADSSIALLFKTHPHPDERLARLGEAMGARFDDVKAGKNLKERLVAGK
ncbi:MAG: M48 family metalloprotease [Burkholderiales bacterium]